MSELNFNLMEQEYLQAYEEHADAIFRYCFFRVHNREVAKDLVQDAFTKTWLYIQRGKKIKNIRAFLYQVSRNLIIDYSRKHKSMSLDNLQEEYGYDIEDQNSENLGLNVDVEYILRYMKKLDEKYMEPVFMRYVDQLTPAEIAEALDISANTASVRITRGIAQLKELIKENEQQNGRKI